MLIGKRMAEKTKTERDFELMANNFHMADSVKLEVEGKIYAGRVDEIRIGEYIIFSVKNMDNRLVQLSTGLEKLSLKVSRAGKLITYPTSLLNKKLPKLMLKFPEKEADKVLRSAQRAHLCIRTPLFHVKRKNMLMKDDNYGLGTLTNMSEGGCSITINMDLQKEDRIDFFLEVNSEKLAISKADGIADAGTSADDRKRLMEMEGIATSEKKLLELSGIVRSTKEQSPGVYNLGVQFVSLDNDTVEEITAYMKRRLKRL